MRICFVAHFAYGAIKGGRSGHVGGVEHQTSMMARWLAAKGHTVSVVVWNEGQQPEEVVEGIRIISLCSRSAGLPILRFFYPRWTSLLNALANADADVYYQNCAEYVTGQVALWCNRNNKAFVYSIASDPDCDPKLPTLKSFRERVLYRYGLSRAHRIIVQTEFQRKMLESGFSLDAVPIGMPCKGPDESEFQIVQSAKNTNEFRVVWVGRFDRIKRVELFLNIAKANPNITFDLVGGMDQDKEYASEILSLARGIPNLVIHGVLPRDKVQQIYQKASVLCCTSIIEGFPNTFLEAWSFGLPIISTVDPDKLIQIKKLGMFFEDANSISQSLCELKENVDVYRDMSKRCRAYYLENHQLERVMTKFEIIFEEVIANQ